MDWLKNRENMRNFLKKYGCVGLILVLGIVLMLLPERRTETVTEEETSRVYETLPLQESLEEILSQIDGAGQVRVLLTVAQGVSTLYQTDATDTGESRKVETVIITDKEKAQQGLIRQVNPETYLGAVVVCRGGDNPTVKLAITQAVAAATGLSTDKITVLKMK